MTKLNYYLGTYRSSLWLYFICTPTTSWTKLQTYVHWYTT